MTFDIVDKDLPIVPGQLFDMGIPNDLDTFQVNSPLGLIILGFSLNQPYARTASTEAYHHDPKDKTL